MSENSNEISLRGVRTTVIYVKTPYISLPDKKRFGRFQEGRCHEFDRAQYDIPPQKEIT